MLIADNTPFVKEWPQNLDWQYKLLLDIGLSEEAVKIMSVMRCGHVFMDSFDVFTNCTYNNICMHGQCSICKNVNNTYKKVHQICVQCTLRHMPFQQNVYVCNDHKEDHADEKPRYLDWHDIQDSTNKCLEQVATFTCSGKYK